MLNLKKGLALVLAAATAFTVAPVSTLGLNSVVAQAAQTPTINLTTDAAGEESTSSIDLAQAAPGNSADIYLTVANGNTDKINWHSTDNTVVADTDIKLNNTENLDNNSVNTSNAGSSAYATAGKTKITITSKAAGDADIQFGIGSTKNLKTLHVHVLGTADNTKLEANVSDGTLTTEDTSDVTIGSIDLTGKELSKDITSNQPGISSVTTGIKKVTKNASGNEVKTPSSNIAVSVDTTPSSVTNNTLAKFDVKAKVNSGVEAGDVYEVSLPSISTSKFTTPQTTTAKTFRITIVTAPKYEFTYGGVLEHIYAYKGASYDLAEHASISYIPEGTSKNSTTTAITLNPNEIKWYLVDGAAAPTKGVARDTIKSLNIPTTAGTVSDGVSGSLKVTVSDPDAFSTAVSGAKIVGEAYINGVRTIVYVSKDPISVTEITGNVKNINAGISVSKQGQGITEADKELGVLDEKIANPDKDNIYLKASQIEYPVENPTEAQTDNKYTLTVKTGAGNDNPFKGSFLSLKSGYTKANKLPTGNYYETAYIPFKITDNGNSTTYILKVDITVSVNTGVQFRVKDGSSILATTYGTDELAKDPTVYLNLADKKTFDIFDHIESDVDKTKVSFSYDKDSANVDVDSKGVITPKSVGNAVVTIKASYNGIESSTTLRVRVSQYGFDTVTVKGQDGETARVLSVRDYDNNNEKDITEAAGNDGEYQLVTRQIPYVEIHITGSESSNVVESPVATSANGAALSYSFDDDVKTMSARGLTIDPSTGKITLDYNKCKTGDVLGVYAVKVVSAATSKSEATTSYYYVVVDYPDQPIKGLEDNYTVGTCNDNSRYHTDYPAVELYEESGKTAKNFTEVNKNTDDFKGASLYADDNTDAFDVTAIGQTGRNNSILNPTSGKASIDRATADKQTMHVVAFNAKDPTKKVGGTYKLITVTSAPAVENKVVKITNRDTGAVIYDDAKDSKKTAVRLSINDITHIQVTLAYPVAASGSSLVTTELKGHDGDHDGDVVNQYRYVTAVLNSNDIDATLYPNEKGTQVIGVMPGGHLTNTDRRDIHKKEVKLAVEYDGSNGNTAKPAKITGVKVGNKKGAKVVVKFTKSSLDKNGLSMKYYVQKKVGKKTSGKSIGSARTTLSVKKGATVKVRVKAYYYDAAGQKHVGAYSKWVTKKTDKK